jgi:hypothetical protein
MVFNGDRSLAVVGNRVAFQRDVTPRGFNLPIDNVRRWSLRIP